MGLLDTRCYGCADVDPSTLEMKNIQMTYQLNSDTTILINFSQFIGKGFGDTLTVDVESLTESGEEPNFLSHKVYLIASVSDTLNSLAVSLKTVPTHALLRLTIKGNPLFQRSIFIHKDKLRNLSSYTGVNFMLPNYKISSLGQHYYSIDTIQAEPPYSKSKPDDSLFRHLSDTLNVPAFLSKYTHVAKLGPQSCFFSTKDQFYPDVHSISTLYQCTRYINTNFKKPTSDSVSRIEFEKFWLDAGQKSFSKSRELIRVYYNRIRLANEYFTSYKEGWKTDRGMIFSVWGLPDMIDTDLYSEKWVYYNEQEGDDLEFLFNRIIDSPVDNDFRLVRLSSYEFVWNNAVANWNKGNIFNLIDE